MKKHLRILITAGPTIEPIDPVRFISNRSTGRMGYELAREARKRGHKTTLISGPAGIAPPGGIRFLRVETARELSKAVRSAFKKCDVLVMASAVSDYRPRAVSRRKFKSKNPLELRLVRNPDILKSIPGPERKKKVLVGFSLETERLLENAAKKLKGKNLDLIVANRIGRGSSPFGEGRKTVHLLDKYGSRKKLEKMTKSRIASAILDTAEELCYTSN